MFYKNNMCNYEFRDLNAFDEFILGWGGNCQTFPQYLHHFMFLPAMIKGSNFSTPSPTLVSFRFYPSICEVVSFSLSLSFFSPLLKAWGSLFPDQGSNLWPLALEIQSLNHWTTRAVPPCGSGLLFPDG